MIETDIERITSLDLENLKNNKVTEKKTLEYKLTLPGKTDREKKEFLADVTSLATHWVATLFMELERIKKITQ